MIILVSTSMRQVKYLLYTIYLLYIIYSVEPMDYICMYINQLIHNLLIDSDSLSKLLYTLNLSSLPLPLT